MPVDKLLDKRSFLTDKETKFLNRAYLGVLQRKGPSHGYKGKKWIRDFEKPELPSSDLDVKIKVRRVEETIFPKTPKEDIWILK
jgi:hypothetical protein